MSLFSTYLPSILLLIILTVSVDSFEGQNKILVRAKKPQQAEKCVKEGKPCNCNCCYGLYCMRVTNSPSRICQEIAIGQKPPAECKPTRPTKPPAQQDNAAPGAQAIPVVGPSLASGSNDQASSGSGTPSAESIPVVGGGLQQGAETAAQQSPAAGSPAVPSPNPPEVTTTGKPKPNKPSKNPNKPGKPNKKPSTPGNPQSSSQASQFQPQPSQNVPASPGQPSPNIPSSPGVPVSTIRPPFGGSESNPATGSSPNMPYVPSAPNFGNGGSNSHRK